MSSSPQRIPAAPPEAAPLPQQIGKYRVVRKLGEGATSEVFLCRDEFRERDVAVKRVRAAALGEPMDGRYYERFFAAEAALVGQLQHPNVVQIYDAVAEPGESYLVMEYVEGRPPKGPLPEAEAVRIAIEHCLCAGRREKGRQVLSYHRWPDGARHIIGGVDGRGYRDVNQAN